MTGPPADALRQVPLFADLDEDELAQVASAFKERRFAAEETIIQQGSGAAAFFVISSGEARVLVDGQERRTLGPGDHFGEMALIDAGTRTATVIASGPVVCSGVTFWDFQPLVEQNGVIGWKLLQSLIGVYRSERERGAETPDP
ncbi:MAG TPA: cyclic nucleotide-binding domain-containing protein [Solirubrobacteraceae bacterium]|nr:cyclic nucleotide-binding domain-containing protein [Solirubrobacteraceae bacterium]